MRHIEDLTYMCAHVLLNLLNELGKTIRCEDFPRILSFSQTRLINSIIQEYECEILSNI